MQFRFFLDKPYTHQYPLKMRDNISLRLLKRLAVLNRVYHLNRTLKWVSYSPMTTAPLGIYIGCVLLI